MTSISDVLTLETLSPLTTINRVDYESKTIWAREQQAIQFNFFRECFARIGTNFL